MRCTCKRDRGCEVHYRDELRRYVVGDDVRVTIITDGSLLLTTKDGHEKAVVEFASPRDAMDFVREAAEALAWKWDQPVVEVVA